MKASISEEISKHRFKELNVACNSRKLKTLMWLCPKCGFYGASYKCLTQTQSRDS